MTVANVSRRKQYTATGGTTGPYTVPFGFFEIEVYIGDDLVDPSEYSITQTTPGSTGSVTFASAPIGVITLLGATEKVQETDYVNNDSFPADSHEKALDRLTMIAQELGLLREYAFRVPPTQNPPDDIDLRGNPDTVFTVNADGELELSSAEEFLARVESAATRAWLDRESELALASYFGAIVLDDDTPTVAAANRVALQDAFDYAAENSTIIRLNGSGVCYVAGDLKTRSNLHVQGSPNFVLAPIYWSTQTEVATPVGGGAFLSNVFSTTNQSDRVQSNVTLRGLVIDGQYLPPGSQGFAQGGTSNTITFAADASATDGYYVGWQVRIFTGTAAGSGIIVTAYNGTTKVATVTGLSGTPDVTSNYSCWYNDNAIGFARGAKNFLVDSCIFRNFAATWVGGGGGKGAQAELGCEDIRIINCIAEDCGFGFSVQGNNENFGAPTNEHAGTRRIILIGNTARRCEVGLLLAGYDTDSQPDGDTMSCSVVALGLHTEDCGALVSRRVSTPQKSAPIVLLEAQNCYVSGWKDTVTDTYAPYPGAIGTVGDGLTLPRGAAIAGWGRNIYIDGDVHGPVEYGWYLDNLVGVGDDATPDSNPRFCLGNTFNIRYHSDTPLLASCYQNSTGGTCPVDEMGTRLTISHMQAGPSVEIIGDNMSYAGLHVDLSVHSANVGNTEQIRRVSGPANFFNAHFNDWALVPVGHMKCEPEYVVSGVEHTIADDEILTITPPFDRGFIDIVCRHEGNYAGVSGTIYYCLSGTARCELLTTATNIAVGTAALTSGTSDGTDTKLNVAAVLAAGTIIIKNRMGASQPWSVRFRL